MKSNNFIEKSFGPIGAPAGMFLLLFGIIATFYSTYGILLIISGAFIGFTSQSTIIDIEGKKIRSSNNLFGLIRTGRWITIDPSMRLGIKKSNKTWGANSAGNRHLNIDKVDFRIILYDSESKLIMPVKKVNSLKKANSEIVKLKHLLKIRSI